jgi:hypothetical protein
VSGQLHAPPALPSAGILSRIEYVALRVVGILYENSEKQKLRVYLQGAMPAGKVHKMLLELMKDFKN